MKVVVAGVTGIVKSAAVSGAKDACCPKMIAHSVRDQMNREDAWAGILKELDRQVEKWGRPDGEWCDDIHKKNTVLGEEVGEVANAILERDWDNLQAELTQVAAVCVSILMSEFPRKSRYQYMTNDGGILITSTELDEADKRKAGVVERLGHKGGIGYYGD